MAEAKYRVIESVADVRGVFFEIAVSITNSVASKFEIQYMY